MGTLVLDVVMKEARPKLAIQLIFVKLADIGDVMNEGSNELRH